MTAIEKRFCIDNILEGLEGNHIPYKYNKRRRIICINGVDVTKLLLAACEVYVMREEELHNITTKDRIEVYGKLNKAKELLVRFVMASAYFNGKETDLVEQAEQFLKE